MNNQILKIFALVMLLGALILAVIAYRLGNSPSAPTPAGNGQPVFAEPKFSMVVAARDLNPGEPIPNDALRIVKTDTPPEKVYDNINEVAGKRPWAAISKDQPILRNYFSGDNPLGRALRQNERAIAVKVDEIIGVGGFVESGDLVDLVAFVRGDHQAVKDNQAVMILRAVRVISYGNEFSAPSAEKSEEREGGQKGKTGRNTAVLAVDSADLPRIALIENAATLRMALRPSNAVDTDNSPGGITLKDVISQAEFNQKGPLVEIYHGTQLEQIQYP